MSAPIVGSTKEEHLKDALAAEELTLTEDEITALEKPYAAAPGARALLRQRRPGDVH